MGRGEGFTLVELLVVVLILGSLAAIAIPRISQSAENANINACRTNVNLLNSQIELYRANTGEWPANLAVITGNADYFPDGLPKCPFEVDYVLNENHRVAQHSHGNSGAPDNPGGPISPGNSGNTPNPPSPPGLNK